MLQTLPERVLITSFVACILWSPTTQADTYAEARADLFAAYQAGDFPAMRQAAQNSLNARPGYPGALFNRALAEVLDGDDDAAMATLDRIVNKQINFGVENIEEFVALKEHAGWDQYLAAIARISEPVGEADVAAESDQSDFIPEGIAVDAVGDIILGSIRHGTFLIDPGAVPEMTMGPFGHWSVFGMRFDSRGGLWFASSRVPQFAGSSDRSAYKAGLFRYDPESLDISNFARLPVVDGDQVLGDLVIADDDTIYTTDSIDGPVYRYSITGREFLTLVPKGVFGSPQGLVLDASGEYLYVADYIGGLYRVRLDEGVVEKVVLPDSISDFGIDGLYRHGNRLIAIQNGIQPHRVVALSLSDGGDAIESVEILAMNLSQFDEPTLGAVVGDSFYFVANSHWNRFDSENKLPEGLTGPIVLRVLLK